MNSRLFNYLLFDHLYKIVIVNHVLNIDTILLLLPNFYFKIRLIKHRLGNCQEIVFDANKNHVIIDHVISQVDLLLLPLQLLNEGHI